MRSVFVGFLVVSDWLLDNSAIIHEERWELVMICIADEYK